MRKQTIIEGSAQSGPVCHTASDGKPWAVFTVDCGSWVRVVVFGEVAARLHSTSFGRGSPVRCAGRISVRSGDVRNRGQQMQIELIADDVQPVAETATAVIG